MATLSKKLRKQLESKVREARKISEAGAIEALTALAVPNHEPYSSLALEERSLRNRLRARGRALGDELDRRSGKQEISHLVQLVAYEHWHRMLFARFLAENECLIHPDLGVPVSLEECREIARDDGRDVWEMIGGFAVKMLPQIFRVDDPALEIALPREKQIELEGLLEALPTQVFTADDSLGWTYQFWQIDEKERINKSDEPRGSNEIPAVTQFFTEDYMVEFLLHNTLGAWWVGKQGPIEAEDEAKAREKAGLPAKGGLPEVSWKYLRFSQNEQTKLWFPATGILEGWPKETKEITLLDPCMGSGHFLVFALPILARMRMEEEELSGPEVVAATLRDNIHGLELDLRCTQLGAFNLALTAWRLAGYQSLPSLQLACCGLAPQGNLRDWLAVAGDDEKLRCGMERLYRLFEKAPIIGSLVDPRRGGDLIDAEFHEMEPLLEKAVSKEDIGSNEIAISAKGIAKAAEILAGEVHLVSTNVPYLGAGKQDQVLRNYCERFHEFAKADLAFSFVDRCFALCSKGGTVALVTPQSWLFLVEYQHFRRVSLTSYSWHAIARLGARAFETISGEVVNVALAIIENTAPTETQSFSLLDVSGNSHGATDKATALTSNPVSDCVQTEQLKNPDSAIRAEPVGDGSLLGLVAGCYQGVSSTDAPRFIVRFWELPRLDARWIPEQNPPAKTNYFGGREMVIDWETLTSANSGAALRGKAAHGKRGIALGQVKSLPATLYSGEQFADSSPVIIPYDEKHYIPIWCFVKSPEFNIELRKTNPKLSVNNGYIGKIPFDLEYWQKVAIEMYPDGLPKPHSNDPTQWLFIGSPAGSDQPIHVAVARLLGYRWPRQTGSSFPDCPCLSSDGLDSYADDDGIVCLMAIRGEDSCSERIRELLSRVMAGYCVDRESEMIAATFSDSNALKQIPNLGTWLRDYFFEQHCAFFHHRPFIWHIWDGRKDGFHALVNYHQLTAPNGEGSKLLETLTYSYLGDWIRRQEGEVSRGESGAEGRLAAALDLKKELEKIIAGEPPYDLFIRWKPLHEQPIGWDPDINDGVRLNIRPFLLAKDVGKKGAGILRCKPNIKWSKDRGMESQRPREEYPWFWGWDEESVNWQGGEDFKGERFNGLHYDTKTKQAARDLFAKSKEVKSNK